MKRSITDPRISAPDDIYERLVQLHSGQSDEESARINARLILLLINCIGDEEAVMEAIALAAERPARRGPEEELAK
jgi:hypothetical protein